MTTSAVEAELAAQQPVSDRRGSASPARRRAPGTTDVRGHDRRTPAAIAARNGTQRAAASVADRSAARGASPAPCRRGRGSASRRRRRLPPAARRRTRRRAARRARGRRRTSGRRSPGCRGFALTSATGARSRLTPTRGELGRRSRAATASVSSTSSTAPERRGCPGYELPRSRLEPRDVAALLVDGDHAARRAGAQPRRSARAAAPRSRDVAGEQARPRRARARAGAATQSGGVGRPRSPAAAQPRREALELVRSSLHRAGRQARRRSGAGRGRRRSRPGSRSASSRPSARPSRCRAAS